MTCLSWLSVLPWVPGAWTGSGVGTDQGGPPPLDDSPTGTYIIVHHNHLHDIILNFLRCVIMHSIIIIIVKELEHRNHKRA